MDGSYHIDRDAMLAAVRERDHLVFRFNTVSERLFVDFRTSLEDGPGVFVLPPAATVKERMASIREVRPRLPRPKRINIVAWPLRVGGLGRLGVVDAIRLRLADLDGFDALKALDAALDTLDAAEAAELRRAVTGEGYRTLWAARASGAQ